jgi:predicted  nucleic acid-binding Zn-ribbon protein
MMTSNDEYLQKIADMDARYRERIANQVKVIERVQDQVHERDRRINDLEAAGEKLTQELMQAREDIRVLRRRIKEYEDGMPQPEAVWDRRVPEEPRSGPAESNGEETLPFNAFGTFSGEERPAKTF